MRRQPNKYKPHKRPLFYCDEDFPKPSLLKLKRFKVKHSVLDFDHSGRDDQFHYQFASTNKAILLTLDDDYLDNSRFKLKETYGVIVIKVGQFPTWERVNQVLDKLISLLKDLDSQSLKRTKIITSLEGYVKINLDNNKIVKEEMKW